MKMKQITIALISKICPGRASAGKKRAVDCV